MTDDRRLSMPKNAKPADDGLTQSERFMQAAQELGTDDDPDRFAERVRKIAGGQSRTAGSFDDDGQEAGTK